MEVNEKGFVKFTQINSVAEILILIMLLYIFVSVAGYNVTLVKYWIDAVYVQNDSEMV